MSRPGEAVSAPPHPVGSPDHHADTDTGLHANIGSCRVYSPAQHRTADQQAIRSGHSLASLIDAAGQAVTDRVLSCQRSHVVTLCGPGNNGDDGRVAAGLLAGTGHTVQLLDWDGTDAGAASVDAELGHVVAALDARDTVVVDALLGAGMTRPVSRPLQSVFERVETWRIAGARVVAVDLPSGLDGATGQPTPSSVQADDTVTFSAKKPGHVLMPGRERCGTVTVADIGIDDTFFDPPDTWENRPDRWAIPRRSVTGHKYDAGHVMVVSGPRWQTGASRLAALAALRVGAGAVTIGGDASSLDVHAAHVTEVMLALVDEPGSLSHLVNTRRVSAIVVGPAFGMSQRHHDLLADVVDIETGLVVDADAISIVADAPTRFAAALKHRAAPTVLTPHGGEFARLWDVFGERSSDDPPQSADKLSRTRHLARRLGVVVVHKGADTVIAAPDGRALVNTNAPPNLATAGSGDVLAGFVAGLIAQGMPAVDAAAAAVWMHGAAAHRAPVRLIASDLLEAVADIQL